MVRTLVCIEAGQCNAHELDCVDVPVEVLTDSTASQWFNSRGALDRLTQLLTLYNSSAVSQSHVHYVHLVTCTLCAFGDMYTMCIW